MSIQLSAVGLALAALLAAALVALVSTPVIRSLAFRVGAVDVPKDARRMHDHPIPRMGGLAIFLGFILSVLISLPLSSELRGMLLGSVIIVILGVFDDIFALPAMPKFLIQIGAALIAVLEGNRIEFLSNPNIFSKEAFWELGWLSVPITIFWIVGITNAVNLIDGLDGLACGVSTISSMTLLVIALVMEEPDVAILMAALSGACLGFLPYNLNPAKIFMGDTGSTFLGFILATVSIQGLFKFYTIISFAVPFLMLGLPIFDTSFAILRRVSHGQSPMKPDRGHIHHRLIDMGFTQKQAVAVLYIISAILGLSAVVLTTIGVVRAMLFLVALCAAGAVAAKLYLDHGGSDGGVQPSGQHRVARPRKSRPMDSGNYFGEEDQSDK
ncbi:MAG: undecaprenyl/decaprenyl-phosphate alpha-N-acetylglucosaminyl 1-phosphate transferase [Lawsonibacter sp.]|nr:undecaprenyl/decaprenyl-phosphate alpha-N-acetylglucosaminyl 1-phosphate transferase [Lawsonibacter sp.]